MIAPSELLWQAMGRDMRIALHKRVKHRARVYLDPATRWQLEAIWPGLSDVPPLVAIACLKWLAEMPSYQRAEPSVNLRAAMLAMRYRKRSVQILAQRSAITQLKKDGRAQQPANRSPR